MRAAGPRSCRSRPLPAWPQAMSREGTIIAGRRRWWCHRSEPRRRRVGPICKVLPIAPLRLSRSSGMRADPARLSDHARRDVGPKPGIGRASDAGFRVHGVREIWRHPPVTPLRDALPGNGQVGPVSAGPREPSAPRTGPGHAPGRRRQARRDVGGLRPRRIRDRCPCPTHRRPARRSHRPCRVRSRCPGTGRPPAPSGKGGLPRASLRQGCPISCDTRHRAPRTSRHRALGRSGAFAAPPGPRSPSPSGTLVTPRWPRRIDGPSEAEAMRRRGPRRSFDAVEYAALEWVHRFDDAPPAGAHRKHPARRGGSDLPGRHGTGGHGRVTRSNQPAPDPVRFTFAPPSPPNTAP